MSPHTAVPSHLRRCLLAAGRSPLHGEPRRPGMGSAPLRAPPAAGGTPLPGQAPVPAAARSRGCLAEGLPRALHRRAGRGETGRQAGTFPNGEGALPADGCAPVAPSISGRFSPFRKPLAGSVQQMQLGSGRRELSASPHGERSAFHASGELSSSQVSAELWRTCCAPTCGEPGKETHLEAVPQDPSKARPGVGVHRPSSRCLWGFQDSSDQLSREQRSRMDRDSRFPARSLWSACRDSGRCRAF